MTRHNTIWLDTTKDPSSATVRNFFFTEKVGQVVSLTPTFVNWVVAEKKKQKSENEGRQSRPGRTVRTSGPSILGTSFRIPGSRDSSFLRLLHFSSQPFFDLRERAGGTAYGTRHKLHQLPPLPVVTHFCGYDAADRKNVAFCYVLLAGLLFFLEAVPRSDQPTYLLPPSIFDT